jgi:uncharacterized membrane protein YhaH (DUF805 family)
LGPIRSIITCLRKSFDFSGRATRAEFWWFLLAIWIVVIGGFYLIDLKLYGLDFDDPTALAPFADTINLLTMPASLSVTKRRFNDAGFGNQVGWLAVIITFVSVFLSFYGQLFDVFNIPSFSTIDTSLIILSLLVLVAAIKRSSPCPNRYGPNPREVTP